MLLVIKKHSMCAAMAETSLSAAVIGKIDMKQMADMKSMQGPQSPLCSTVHLTEALLKLSTISRDQTDPAIPNKMDSLIMNGIAAGISAIGVVLVHLEDVTGLAALLSVLLLCDRLQLPSRPDLCY